MAIQVATKIIDGDGHINEDFEGIHAHLAAPYRERVRNVNGIFPPLDHLHAGRVVETPPTRDGRARVGPRAGSRSWKTLASSGPSSTRRPRSHTARSSVWIMRSRFVEPTTTGCMRRICSSIRVSRAWH